MMGTQKRMGNTLEKSVILQTRTEISSCNMQEREENAFEKTDLLQIFSKGTLN